MATPAPVLVTGAGGFVGGHVARLLAAAGHPVRALTRRPPAVRPGDPAIDWLVGDLRREDDRARAVAGAWGVVHSAGWVNLGADPRGDARAINVEATRGLLDQAEAAGVARFVFTSTLWTVAAGPADRPADEDSPWNLDAIRCPYCETKREAERLVLARSNPRMGTAALCPGLVLGPRDPRPTSTRLLLTMAGTPAAILPDGGIPVVDARVLATAHLRALERAGPGRRYVVAGPYLSYRELAGLVRRVAGRPLGVVRVPDALRGPMSLLGGLAGRLARGRPGHISAASMAGGFLRLHVTGARADAAFGLAHPAPILSIYEALADHRGSGLAPWLRLRRPDEALAEGEPGR